MLKQEDIQKAVASVLKEKTGLVVYKNSVVEGFKGPCFFLSVTTERFAPANKCTFSVSTRVQIEYFPYVKEGEIVRDADDGVKMMGKLAAWFMPNIEVCDRFLIPSNIGFSFLGTNTDILQFSFTLDYFDSADEEAEGTMIARVELF